MQNHEEDKEYVLHGQAYETYRAAHDHLVDLKVATTDENLQGIYAKARGYVARVAMIIHCLELAVAMVAPQSDTDTFDDNSMDTEGTSAGLWVLEVSSKAVEASRQIIAHLNKQKVIMMGLHGAGTYII